MSRSRPPAARSLEHMQRDGDEEAFFYAQQNARLVKNAEEY
jgi:hypothetical protein